MIAATYSSGNSFLHSFDPRCKIIIAGLFAAVTATSGSFYTAWAALAIATSLLLLARLPLRKIARLLVAANSFILFIWVFLPFGTPGHRLFAVGPFTATVEGINTSALITIRANSIILATLALLSTSGIFELAHALRHFHVPEKLVNLLFFVFRYIYVIHEEYIRLTNAMKARAFVPGSNLHTYRTFANLVGMLLVKSHSRSERVYQAMICRGFRDKLWLFKHFEMKKSDWTGLILMLLLITGLLFISWKPHLI